MIHAYFFLEKKPKILDRSGHGEDFENLMNEINKIEGTKITVYHSFIEEVNLYRKHVWRCEGVCRFKGPFFGYVKRTMNRAPQPADSWWSRHLIECGGTFKKISEPEGKNKALNKQSKTKSKANLNLNQSKITADKKNLKCPNCDNFKSSKLEELNGHLDECLEMNLIKEIKTKRNIIDLT